MFIIIILPFIVNIVELKPSNYHYHQQLNNNKQWSNYNIKNKRFFDDYFYYNPCYPNCYENYIPYDYDFPEYIGNIN